MEEKKKGIELKIKVDEQTAQGTYANFLSALHNQAEFVLDFGRMMPGKPEVNIVSRIVTNPLALKQMVRTLQENLERYEKTFGDAPTSPPMPPTKDFIQLKHRWVHVTTILLLGALIGTVVGQILGALLPAGPLRILLSEGLTVGIREPLVLDLAILRATFGLLFSVNLFTVAGVLAGALLLRGR